LSAKGPALLSLSDRVPVAEPDALGVFLVVEEEPRIKAIDTELRGGYSNAG
jgi:hypothetical protein